MQLSLAQVVTTLVTAILETEQDVQTFEQYIDSEIASMGLEDFQRRGGKFVVGVGVTSRGEIQFHTVRLSGAAKLKVVVASLPIHSYVVLQSNASADRGLDDSRSFLEQLSVMVSSSEPVSASAMAQPAKVSTEQLPVIPSSIIPSSIIPSSVISSPVIPLPESNNNDASELAMTVLEGNDKLASNGFRVQNGNAFSDDDEDNAVSDMEVNKNTIGPKTPEEPEIQPPELVDLVEREISPPVLLLPSSPLLTTLLSDLSLLSRNKRQSGHSRQQSDEAAKEIIGPKKRGTDFLLRNLVHKRNQACKVFLRLLDKHRKEMIAYCLRNGAQQEASSSNATVSKPLPNNILETIEEAMFGLGYENNLSKFLLADGGNEHDGSDIDNRNYEIRAGEIMEMSEGDDEVLPRWGESDAEEQLNQYTKEELAEIEIVSSASPNKKEISTTANRIPIKYEEALSKLRNLGALDLQDAARLSNASSTESSPLKNNQPILFNVDLQDLLYDDNQALTTSTTADDNTIMVSSWGNLQRHVAERRAERKSYKPGTPGPRQALPREIVKQMLEDYITQQMDLWNTKHKAKYESTMVNEWPVICHLRDQFEQKLTDLRERVLPKFKDGIYDAKVVSKKEFTRLASNLDITIFSICEYAHVLHLLDTGTTPQKLPQTSKASRRSDLLFAMRRALAAQKKDTSPIEVIDDKDDYEPDHKTIVDDLFTDDDIDNDVIDISESEDSLKDFIVPDDESEVEAEDVVQPAPRPTRKTLKKATTYQRVQPKKTKPPPQKQDIIMRDTNYSTDSGSDMDIDLYSVTERPKASRTISKTSLNARSTLAQNSTINLPKLQTIPSKRLRILKNNNVPSKPSISLTGGKRKWRDAHAISLGNGTRNIATPLKHFLSGHRRKNLRKPEQQVEVVEKEEEEGGQQAHQKNAEKQLTQQMRSVINRYTASELLEELRNFSNRMATGQRASSIAPSLFALSVLHDGITLKNSDPAETSTSRTATVKSWQTTINKVSTLLDVRETPKKTRNVVYIDEEPENAPRKRLKLFCDTSEDGARTLFDFAMRNIKRKDEKRSIRVLPSSLRPRRGRPTFAIPKPSEVAIVQEMSARIQERASQQIKEVKDGIVINLGHEEEQQDIYIPPYIADHLQQHQIDGIRHMWKLSMLMGKGCILAHSMGLGKTLQAFAIIITVFTELCNRNMQIPEHLKERRVLVVTPKTVVSNWMDESLRWIPEEARQLLNLRVWTLEDCTTLERRLRRVELWHQIGGVLIVSYSNLRSLIIPIRRDKIEEPEVTGNELVDDAAVPSAASLAGEFRRMLISEVSMLILDEAHIVKNDKTQLAALFSSLSTPTRIALTGTPLQNNLREYWVMADLVAPNFLGTEEEFKNSFTEPIMEGQHADSTVSSKRKAEYALAVLTEYLDEFVHRRDTSILREQLPTKYEYVVYCNITQLQLELMEELVTNRQQGDRKVDMLSVGKWITYILNHPTVFKRACENTDRRIKPPQQQLSKIQELSGEEDSEDVIDLTEPEVSPSLHQWLTQVVAAHPNFNALQWSPKMQTAMAIMEECRRRDEKVLFFSHSIETLNVVQLLLNERGFRVARLDGSMESKPRQKAVKDFNTIPQISVFLISTRAGSQGINLCSANCAIIFDLDWNPVHEEQAAGRIFRMGQARSVYVYRLICMDAFEHIVFSKHVKKLSLAQEALDKKNFRKIYSKEDANYFQLELLQKRLTRDIKFTPETPSELEEGSVLERVLNELRPYNAIIDIENYDTFFQTLDKSEIGERLKKHAKEYARQKRATWRKGQRFQVDYPRELTIDIPLPKADGRFNKTTLPPSSTSSETQNVTKPPAGQPSKSNVVQHISLAALLSAGKQPAIQTTSVLSEPTVVYATLSNSVIGVTPMSPQTSTSPNEVQQTDVPMTDRPENDTIISLLSDDEGDNSGKVKSKDSSTAQSDGSSYRRNTMQPRFNLDFSLNRSADELLIIKESAEEKIDEKVQEELLDVKPTLKMMSNAVNDRSISAETITIDDDISMTDVQHSPTTSVEPSKTFSIVPISISPSMSPSRTATEPLADGSPSTESRNEHRRNSNNGSNPKCPVM